MQDELARELKKAEERAEFALFMLELMRAGLVDEILQRKKRSLSMVNLGLWCDAAKKENKEGGEGRKIAFHIPATQQYRPSTFDGRTSFTFQFSSVTKLQPNKLKKAGKSKLATKPKGHQRQSKPVEHASYIERSDAVALIDDDLLGDPEIPSIEMVQEHFSAKPNFDAYARLAEALFDGPVHEPDFGDAGSACRPLPDGPGNAVPNLSVGKVDRAGGGALEGPVHDDGQVGRAKRHADKAVRWMAPEPELFYEGFLNAPPNRALLEDWYIDRPAAVAVQPDGTRLLLTNIDRDSVKRTEFWRLVEEHERESKPDQMSAKFGDDPVFWQKAVAASDCPKSLRSAYAAADHSCVSKFEIDDAAEMRKFLNSQPGWIKPGRCPDGVSKKKWLASQPAAQALLHAGRDGRTQYRLIGELPHEAGAQGSFEILRELVRELEKRNLPFVAVVHAPDLWSGVQN